MDLDLTFANGNMTGSGSDNIGPFSIKGRYDPGNQECYWTKSYLGAHDVFYRGFREGKGIWGTWEIGIFGRGGFHIWPLHSAESEEQTATTHEAEPIEAGASAPASEPAISQPEVLSLAFRRLCVRKHDEHENAGRSNFPRRSSLI